MAIATGSAGLFAMATRQDPLTGRDLSWREAVLEGVFGALDLVGTVAIGYSAVRGVGGLGRVGAEAFSAAGGGWRGAGEAARAVSRQARRSVARQAASIVEDVATVKPFVETGLGRALAGTRVGRWLEAADEGLASSGRAVAGKIAEGYSRAASRVERLIEERAGKNTGFSKIKTKDVVDPLVDPAVARRVGRQVADDPVAYRSYRQIQESGRDVILDFRTMSANDRGWTTSGSDVEIYMLSHESVDEVVSTIVHESSHVRRMSRRVLDNVRYEEYRAYRREFLFKEGRRPSLTERRELWEQVKNDYPRLREGRNPFGN